MKDEFWNLLSKLQEIGKFEFKEVHSPSPQLRKKYPHLFNKRGSIYKLLRCYFLNQIEYGYCSSLGHIQIQWDQDLKFDKILLKFIDTFRILYQLNDLLWLEEIKMKSKKNSKKKLMKESQKETGNSDIGRYCDF